MGKELASTKKFIKKGGLKRELARRPALKKANERRTHRLHKAKEFDAKDKSQKALEDNFKKQLATLVKQKKQLPGEDQVDFSDFLKSRLDSDDEFDISEDEEGDLEFGTEGQSMKGKKGKQAKKNQKAQMDDEEDDEEDNEGGDFEGEEDDEGGDFEGAENDEEGSFAEPGDFDDDEMDTEEREDNEEEEGEGEEGGQGEEGEDGDFGDDDFKSKLSRAERKKYNTQENMARLLDEENLDLDEEIEAHRQELRSLKELDPSFFEYLAQEGTDVLDFDKMSKEMKEKKQTESGGVITVTSKMLQGWITKAIEDDSVEDVKKILTAFQVSVMSEEEAIESQMPFRIERESVFNELVVFCLEQMPDIFYDLMDDAGKAAKPAKPSDAPNAKNVNLNSLPGFSKIKNLVLIYANVIFRLIEEASDDQMLTFIVTNTVQFIPFVATSPGHTKQFLRSLMHIWSSASKEARTAAYICLRQLTLYVPFPFINTVLRGLYLVFMQNCKSMSSAAAMDFIAFMRGCIVEMYGMDFECSYQHIFNYLRQLAVTLQKGLVAPTANSLGQVYSWQYLNALRLWTDVLCKYPKQQHLQHLLYPLIQIIQGSVTVDAQPRYYPYRVHLIRMLNDLATSNTQTFINSAPYTLDILGGSFLQTTYPFGDKNTAVDFKVMRKISENALRTRQFQDELMNQITELLATNLATYAYSVSFPELATFPIKILTTFLEQRSEGAGTAHLAQLRTSLEQSATHIRKLRDKTDKAPKEITNGLTTFFSTNLKNTDKSPLVAFLAKFNKQMAKLEAILNEKRLKVDKFTNYESDEEKGEDDSDDDDEENTQNGTTTTSDEEKPKTDKDNKNKNKRKKREQAKKAKVERRKEQGDKIVPEGGFKADVTGELTLSDDDDEQPKQKKAKTNKPKQNGSTEQKSKQPKVKQSAKPLNGKKQKK